MLSQQLYVEKDLYKVYEKNLPFLFCLIASGTDGRGYFMFGELLMFPEHGDLQNQVLLLHKPTDLTCFSTDNIKPCR